MLLQLTHAQVYHTMYSKMPSMPQAIVDLSPTLNHGFCVHSSSFYYTCSYSAISGCLVLMWQWFSTNHLVKPRSFHIYTHKPVYMANTHACMYARINNNRAGAHVDACIVWHSYLRYIQTHIITQNLDVEAKPVYKLFQHSSSALLYLTAN